MALAAPRAALSLADEHADLARTNTSMGTEQTFMATEQTLVAWIRASVLRISFDFSISTIFTFHDGHVASTVIIDPHRFAGGGEPLWGETLNESAKLSAR
jgi:uncharacterized membrane protein YidH (DUF202 family)